MLVDVGSHLETRVIALLKKIERSRNPNAIQIRPGRKSKKGGALPAPTPEKKPRRAASNKRRRTKSDPELHKARTNGTLTPDVQCQYSLARKCYSIGLRHRSYRWMTVLIFLLLVHVSCIESARCGGLQP